MVYCSCSSSSLFSRLQQGRSVTDIYKLREKKYHNHTRDVVFNFHTNSYRGKYILQQKPNRNPPRPLVFAITVTGGEFPAPFAPGSTSHPRFICSNMQLHSARGVAINCGRGGKRSPKPSANLQREAGGGALSGLRVFFLRRLPHGWQKDSKE